MADNKSKKIISMLLEETKNRYEKSKKLFEMEDFFDDSLEDDTDFLSSDDYELRKSLEKDTYDDDLVYDDYEDDVYDLSHGVTAEDEMGLDDEWDEDEDWGEEDWEEDEEDDWLEDETEVL